MGDVSIITSVNIVKASLLNTLRATWRVTPPLSGHLRVITVVDGSAKTDVVGEPMSASEDNQLEHIDGTLVVSKLNIELSAS